MTVNRVPVGEPIKGHYLKIIDEQDWDAVQGGLSRRKRQRGPNYANPNLFSNLLRDAVNGCGYYLNTYLPANHKWLKSMCRYDRPGMKRGTVPAVEYARVEHTLMQMIHVMPLAPVDREAQDRLETLSAGLDGMEKRRQWLAANLGNEASTDHSRGDPGRIVDCEIKDRRNQRRVSAAEAPRRIPPARGGGQTSVALVH
jgi:hypothetical protein